MSKSESEVPGLASMSAAQGIWQSTEHYPTATMKSNYPALRDVSGKVPIGTIHIYKAMNGFVASVNGELVVGEQAADLVSTIVAKLAIDRMEHK